MRSVWLIMAQVLPYRPEVITRVDNRPDAIAVAKTETAKHPNRTVSIVRLTY